MIPRSPCFGCPNKAQYCHSICDKYLSYRRPLDLYNAQVARRNVITGYEIEKMIKISRHR